MKVKIVEIATEKVIKVKIDSDLSFVITVEEAKELHSALGHVLHDIWMEEYFPDE